MVLLGTVLKKKKVAAPLFTKALIAYIDQFYVTANKAELYFLLPNGL